MNKSALELIKDTRYAINNINTDLEHMIYKYIKNKINEEQALSMLNIRISAIKTMLTSIQSDIHIEQKNYNHKPCPVCGDTNPDEFYTNSSYCKKCQIENTRINRYRRKSIRCNEG